MAHWSDGLPNKAILGRAASSEYRENCYTETKPRSAVWKDTAVIQAHLVKIGRQPHRNAKYAAGSAQHAKSYEFGQGKNFKTGYGPWANQAHHMLPCEAFSVGYVFSQSEHAILMKVDYDLNNGKNLLFLPSFEADRGFTKVLPDHYGSHPNYTRDVKQAMQKLKNKVGKYVKDSLCESQDPPTDIKADIMALQDDFWDDFTTGAYAGQSLG